MNVEGEKVDDLNSSKYKNQSKLPRVHSQGHKKMADSVQEGSMDVSSDNLNEGIPEVNDPNRAKV